MGNRNIFDSKGEMKTYEVEYKPFNLDAYDVDIQELYERAIEKPEYRSIVEEILNPTVRKIGEKQERKVPEIIGLTEPYPNGVPTQPHILKMLQRILSGDVFIVNVEGGVRGGKDIWMLYMWAKYLMVCPEPIHLALGKSLEHALMTILHSNGFGLLYLIPNGVFERTSDKGAQRGVFSFYDAYGRKKEILFYGNDKDRDYEKFLGFTVGSVYANEGLAQNAEGLNKVIDRMASSKMHLMIMTANPKGEASKFYVEFEKKRLYTEEEIMLLEWLRDTYKDDFDKLEKKIYTSYTDEYGKLQLSDADKDAIKVRNEYFKKMSLAPKSTSWNFLNDDQKLELNELIYQTKLQYDAMLRSYLVKDFAKNLPTNHKFATLSMKKVVNYFRGGENPNGIYNAIDYEYYHFTINDNLAMNELQREEFRRSKGQKGMSDYDRSVLGIRRSTDGAILGMFNDENIIDTPIEEYDNKKNTYRVMALDGGFNHPTGLIDGEWNADDGSYTQLCELHLELKDDDEKGWDYIWERFLGIVRKRKNRRMPDFLIIDPSATSFIRFFQSKGVNVKKANNSVFQAKGKDKTKAVQTENKDTIGIDLLQTAVSKKKYKVHISNRKTIQEIGSYESYLDEKTGKTKVFKINDEMPDCIRYVFNTMFRPQMWLNDNEDRKEDNSYDVKSKQDKQSKVDKAFYEEDGNADFEEYQDPRAKYYQSKGFWN